MSTELLPGIGDRLRLARVARRIPQMRIAVALGISPSVISNIENGYRDPTPELVLRICAVLGVDAGELIPRDRP